VAVDTGARASRGEGLTLHVPVANNNRARHVSTWAPVCDAASPRSRPAFAPPAHAHQWRARWRARRLSFCTSSCAVRSAASRRSRATAATPTRASRCASCCSWTGARCCGARGRACAPHLRARPLDSRRCRCRRRVADFVWPAHRRSLDDLLAAADATLAATGSGKDRILMVGIHTFSARMRTRTNKHAHKHEHKNTCAKHTHKHTRARACLCVCSGPALS
jgi:hypothetical protein